MQTSISGAVMGGEGLFQTFLKSFQLVFYKLKAPGSFESGAMYMNYHSVIPKC